jgi:hypothetical protein
MHRRHCRWEVLLRGACVSAALWRCVRGRGRGCGAGDLRQRRRGAGRGRGRGRRGGRGAQEGRRRQRGRRRVQRHRQVSGLGLGRPGGGRAWAVAYNCGAWLPLADRPWRRAHGSWGLRFGALAPAREPRAKLRAPGAGRRRFAREASGAREAPLRPRRRGRPGRAGGRVSGSRARLHGRARKARTYAAAQSCAGACSLQLPGSSSPFLARRRAGSGRGPRCFTGSAAQRSGSARHGPALSELMGTPCFSDCAACPRGHAYSWLAWSCHAATVRGGTVAGC